MAASAKMQMRRPKNVGKSNLSCPLYDAFYKIPCIPNFTHNKSSRIKLTGIVFFVIIFYCAHSHHSFLVLHCLLLVLLLAIDVASDLNAAVQCETTS